MTISSGSKVKLISRNLAVSLAKSAKKAGYEVYAVGYFGDQDLKHACLETRSIVRQRLKRTCGRLDANFSPEALLQSTKELLKRNKIHAALLSSGLDDSSEVLFELRELIPIVGNQPKKIREVRDKRKFFRELKRLEIPHPKTGLAENLQEARKESKDIGFPVLVKPHNGFAGAGIRKAKHNQELKQVFHDVFRRFDERILIQEYVPGRPASVSLISSSTEAVALTLNEQILGTSEMGQREPFGYCGNIVPFSTSETITSRCKSVAEKAVQHFGLVGSNGVDLVISEKDVPYVVEVNPRFQGSLECVERILDVNIVKAHMEACLQGRLPLIHKHPSTSCVRLILFAPQRSFAPNLSTFHEARDIPLKGAVIEEGEPVCSICIDGADRNSSLEKARALATSIGESLRPTK